MYVACFASASMTGLFVILLLVRMSCNFISAGCSNNRLSFLARVAHLTSRFLKFALFNSTVFVEKNGCLAVKPKSIKLTYAETVRLKDTVEAQNRLITSGGHPTTDSILNDLSTNDQVKVDIKTK